MAENLSTGSIGVDIQPYIDALRQAQAEDAKLTQAVLSNSAAQSKSFAEVAAAAVGYSDRLAAVNMEQQAARMAVASAREELRRLTSQQNELNAAQKKVKEGTDEYTRLQKLLQANAQDIKKVKQAIDESTDAVREEGAAVAAVREARRQELNATRQIEAANKDAAKATKEEAEATKQQAAAAKKAADEADKEARNAGLLVKLEKQLVDLTEQRARATTKAQAQGYNKDISSVSQQIKELKAGSGEEDSGGLFSSLLGKASAATAGLFAFNSVVNRVKQGLSDFGAIKGVQATLSAVAGSASEGAQEFAYVKRESDALGLSLVPTAKAYTSLFAASKEANLSVATTRAVFEGVAGAAKVLNISADDTNGVLRALTQIASKGVVASEELRGQIGERLPGAFGLAAKAMGLTTAELGKQLQAGKILASDFLPKFAAQLKATYGDATANAATQVGANISRINTFLSEGSARVGAIVAPYVAALAQLVTPLKTTSQLAQGLASDYFRQSDSLKELTSTVTPLLARYEELNGTAGRNTAQQKELDAIIQQLAKSVPGAVTQFDAYGKALGINGEAVKKFLADQQNLTRYMNRDALKSNSSDLRALVNEQLDLQKELNNTVAGPDGLKRRLAAEGGAFGGAAVRTLSQKESDDITNDLTARLAKIQDDINANIALRRKLQGKSPLVPIVPPSPKDIDGLIEAQEKVIKALKARQLKAANENKLDGSDFLFGKGGLNAQVDAAQKELDRLLGKVDKTGRAAADKLAAALRALYAERQKLSELASKAAIKGSEDEAEKARLNYEASLVQIQKVKDALIQRERAVAEAARRQGGAAAARKQGGNADGKLEAVQEEQINALKLEAALAYDKELARIAEQRDARIFALEAASNQHEIEEVNRAYDAKLAAQHLGQSKELDALDEAAGIRKDIARKLSVEELAIEEARGRALLALRAQQEQRRIEQERAGADANANLVGATYGLGTGISKPQAELAEQRLLLENQRKYIVESQNLTLYKTGKDAENERRALEAQLARIDQQKKDLDFRAKHFDFSLSKLILGEEDDGPNGPKRQELQKALDETVGAVTNALNEVLQAEQQTAQQRAANATQSINELTATLSAQVQLSKEGSASSIQATLDEIAQQKEVRRQALEDQRKAAQEKVVLDTLTQASAIATSAANIIQGFSLIPVVGPALGIAAAALVVGAFAASKVQAYQAAGNIGKGFFTGGYTGGDGSLQEERGPVHAREFVFDNEKTAQYRAALFEPLHQSRPQDIDWNHPRLRAILPDFELPNVLRQEKAEALRVQHEHSFAPMRQDFAQLHDRLQAIEQTNAQMANRWDSHILPDGGVLLRDPSTGSVHHIKTS